MDDVFSYYYENGQTESHLASVEALVKSLIVRNQNTADFTLNDVSHEALAAVKTLLDEWDFTFNVAERSPNCFDFHIQRRTGTGNLWMYVEATPTRPPYWKCPHCRQGNSNKWWDTNTFCPYCGHRNIVT